MVFVRVLQFLSARQHARDRRRDHRNADGLAVSLLRDALLSSDPAGLFPTWRALDRRAQTATDERAVRYRVPRPRKRRSYLIYPDSIRTGLRRRRFLSLLARPVRD